MSDARPGSRAAWYLRRLAQMSPAEVVWRAETRARQVAWARRRFEAPEAVLDPGGEHPGVQGLPPACEPSAAPAAARAALSRAADELLAGRWTVLGCLREDMDDPDWSLDPVSGQAFPLDQSAASGALHGHGDARHVKQVWEISRHNHVSVLAAAWWVSGDDRYAQAAARHLRSWWKTNAIFRGVNWASGIELGIRLISWAWIRRLLDGWAGAADIFEHDSAAVAQIYWHQRYLETYFSRGSSANNHVIAEAAGWLVASCAFPWFPESRRWQRTARDLLRRELENNTFPDGLTQEQAFGYQGLVTELAAAAGIEALLAELPLDPGFWASLCAMVDALAAVVDCRMQPPRYGDSDDGRALLLDDPNADRWCSLLALGDTLFGACSWWPASTPDVRSTVVGVLVPGVIAVPGRPPMRPSHFAGAGLTILRSEGNKGAELWCCCDGGRHGYLSIGAHAHADALAIELRHAGVEILADPGTYCYHGEPEWRSYFRSTLAHNTLELDAHDQSVSGGPFLWVRHARGFVREIATEGPGPQIWVAEHDGYQRGHRGARHRRRVELDPTAHTLVVVDDLVSAGSHRVRMAFHLGPHVEASLDRHVATLRWRRATGRSEAATMILPTELRWELRRGETGPPLGWYSPAFGRKEPAGVLLGSGLAKPPDVRYRTTLHVEMQGGAQYPAPGRSSLEAAGSA